MRKFFILLTLLCTGVVSANAEVFEAPRLASLADDVVNVRAGPGERYPVLWVFNRKGWPVHLIAEYQNWYKIRDSEGEEGWIYKGLVSSRQTAIISTGEPAPLYRRAKGNKISHLLEADVVVGLEETCAGPALCPVTVAGVRGYIETARLKRF
jgi:SH3-like domain-containing protein